MSTATAEPATGLTVWERWRTGYEARTDEERQRYREYDAAIDRLARLRDGAEVPS